MSALLNRLRYLCASNWAEIAGLGIGAAIALIATVLFDRFDPLLPPRDSVQTEGRVIAFVAGSEEGLDAQVLFRTRDNDYGTIGTPLYANCMSGDRIFLARWRAGRQLKFALRPPICSRP